MCCTGVLGKPGVFPRQGLWSQRFKSCLSHCVNQFRLSYAAITNNLGISVPCNNKVYFALRFLSSVGRPQLCFTLSSS